MSDILAALFMITGALFTLVAALGVLRFPDLPTRMHATAKAGTLGAGLVLLGVAIAYGELGVTLRAVGAVLFLLLTGPAAAQVLVRAGLSRSRQEDGPC